MKRLNPETVDEDRARFYRTGIAIVIFWFIWGFVYAVNLSVVKHETPFHESLVFAFSDAVIWALLTPLVLWIGGAFPVRPPHVISRLLIHLPIALVVIVVHELMDAWHSYLYHTIWPDSDPPLTVLEFFQEVVPYKFYSHFLLYTAIVGVGQLVEHRRQLATANRQMVMLRAHLAESQLESLRLQLQPHFLFNCLNTISGLVLQQPAKARKMIANLARLLRLSLETHESEITLQNEMDFVRAYLDIEQVRFGNRLRILESMPNECLSRYVPAFILQPIVENSIQHGLTNLTTGGQVEVAAVLTDAALEIKISDNGAGTASSNWTVGIGLSNIRSRIHQLYGDEYGLSFESAGDQGTTVVIKLPNDISASS